MAKHKKTRWILSLFCGRTIYHSILTVMTQDGPVGGIVGNSIGFMLVNGEANMPGPWTMWFNSCDFGDISADDDVKETAWAHASKCGRCHEGWKDCGNGDRIIFGKEFESLCHSPLMFTDPDAKTLENLKKLTLMLK